jgi:DNA-binding response OmpR family regulator
MEGRRKMLIVEDSPADVMLVKLALEDTGVELDVIHLADGQEMFDYMQRETAENTAFVLLDLNIPKANGIDILKRKATLDAWKYLPVIMYSSSTREDDIRQCLANGGSAYVCKPVDFAEFNFTIQQIVRFWGQVNLLPRN